MIVLRGSLGSSIVLLSFLTCLTSPLPVGPPLIWLGAAAWLYATSGIGWAIFMLAWGAGLVSMADNIVRPLLISRGGTTPIVLTLLGIIGGVVAFGFLANTSGRTGHKHRLFGFASRSRHLGCLALRVSSISARQQQTCRWPRQLHWW